MFDIVNQSKYFSNGYLRKNIIAMRKFDLYWNSFEFGKKLIQRNTRTSISITERYICILVYLLCCKHHFGRGLFSIIRMNMHVFVLILALSSSIEHIEPMSHGIYHHFKYIEYFPLLLFSSKMISSYRFLMLTNELMQVFEIPQNILLLKTWSVPNRVSSETNYWRMSPRSTWEGEGMVEGLIWMDTGGFLSCVAWAGDITINIYITAYCLTNRTRRLCSVDPCRRLLYTWCLHQKRGYVMVEIE